MSQLGAFDEVAERYDTELARGLAATGEDKDFFARGRIEWLAGHVSSYRAPAAILDFGCGTGSAVPHLRATFPEARIQGVDPSAASVVEAGRRYGALAGVGFSDPAGVPERERFDLAFCNGVFHHIPVGDRLQAAEWVYRHVSPSGTFALYENNPWNPGTRYVMSQIPFDRDAVMLRPAATRRLVERAGFTVIDTAFLFFFPRALRALRPLERRFERVPMGGQYVVLARRT